MSTVCRPASTARLAGLVHSRHPGFGPYARAPHLLSNLKKEQQGFKRNCQQCVLQPVNFHRWRGYSQPNLTAPHLGFSLYAKIHDPDNFLDGDKDPTDRLISEGPSSHNPWGQDNLSPGIKSNPIDESLIDKNGIPAQIDRPEVPPEILNERWSKKTYANSATDFSIDFANPDVGASLLDPSFDIPSGMMEAKTFMTIHNRQPGNNFRIALHDEDSVSHLAAFPKQLRVFEKGFANFVLSQRGYAIPGNVQSEKDLVVARTLIIEYDSLTQPSPAVFRSFCHSNNQF